MKDSSLSSRRAEEISTKLINPGKAIKSPFIKWFLSSRKHKLLEGARMVLFRKMEAARIII